MLKPDIRPSKQSVILLCSFLILLCAQLGCRKEAEKQIVAAVDNRAAMAKLRAQDITTVISDSGITRYRISAARWEIYDRAEPPYWEFPEGIHFERFDSTLAVDASIYSRYAHYDEYNQLWTLKNKVKATNIEGSLFETELLFWSQKTERVYTDSLITITQPNGRVVVGKNGFESNQSLTRYSIRNSNAILPIDENEE